MDTKRGDDAQDHAPQPTGSKSQPADNRQDAKNYKDRTDGGEAIEVENMSSANDEGAN